ncbi:MAG: YcnI family protein [Aeromicrobium sp.]|uniref:YcnI family copper-binding membrane protein n=1 Tax=Aeromicrobium sp. TaxID=1871063 RepID=UPI0039E22E18
MKRFPLPTRPLARLAAGSALVLGAVLATGTAASAHVTVTPSTTAAGSYAVLTFSNGHGCDGSPTTKVSISIPEGIYAVTPTRNPYYSVETVMEPLDEPVDDGYGGQYTERVSEVVYTATTPLPDHQRDTYELSLKLPGGDAGDTLRFPTVQTCESGESAWIDDDPEAELPAPSFTLTAAEDEGHGHGHGAAHESGRAGESGSGTGTVGWIALGLGALGTVLGGAALARSGSRS